MAAWAWPWPLAGGREVGCGWSSCWFLERGEAKRISIPVRIRGAINAGGGGVRGQTVATSMKN
jgi:hypothetical protein